MTTPISSISRLVVVDVEADGPCPGLYSMVSFGAVCVGDVTKTFYGELRPDSDIWVPEALAVSGFSREKTLSFPPAAETMARFEAWLKEQFGDDRPVFVSDNVAFDWQWVNYYFHKHRGANPFGFSGRRIADLFAGFEKDMGTRWKQHRKTEHTHHPVDDAMGNVEALHHLASLGLKGILKTPKAAAP